MPKGVKGFQKGNKGGGRKKANHTIQIEALKKYFVREVIKQKGPLIKALIDKALTGDVQALKEVWERTIGKVSDKLVLEDGGFIEALEEAKRLRNK